MKKLLLTALILAFAGSAYAGTGVVGSKHDIPATKPAGIGVTDEEGFLALRGITGNRICGYCHTPHHANVDPEYLDNGLPLWSRQSTVGASFTNYKSFTLDGVDADPVTGVKEGNAMIGSSWLCLSCHDGTVAVDQHYAIDGNQLLTDDNYSNGGAGGTGVGFGGELGNDHPIGVDMVQAYEAEQRDIDPTAGVSLVSGLNDPATATFIDNPLLGAFTISNYLFEGRYVTCSSCHDVHNKDSVGSEGFMLYSSVAGSDICLSCHNK